MQRLSTVCTVATLAFCSVCALFAQAQKKVKDQGEYDIYNEVIKDIASNNFTKALPDLDTWKQKYPESDYKDDRDVFYLQAYAGAKQPAKALDAAGPLLNKDLDTVFSDPKTGPQEVVKILFTSTVAVQQIPNPTPEELAIGDKAARRLLDYNRKPEGVSDADWAKARDQLQVAAKGALLFVAMKPGLDAIQKKDYATAESVFSKALQQYPDNGQLAYQLGVALLGQQTTDPSKVPAGIYEIARAVSLDPAKSGLDATTRTSVEAYLKKIYTAFHGSEEGLDQLKQQALASPMPPSAFQIKTGAQLAQEKQAAFENSNPELALWSKVRAALADVNGEQYFETSVKDADLPQLLGKVVEAKPACHSKELVVAVPVPGGSSKPEITLKLDAPLTGKPDLDTEFRWHGVPKTFTKDPFMLTMEVEKANLSGLHEEPCAPTPARKGTSKKK